MNRRPRSPGRPRKPDALKRSVVIGVRVSEEEKAIIEENADGRDLSTFLRQAGMAQQPPGQPGRIPLANREVLGQLGRLGNNLNQLVRLAHTGRFPAHLGELLQRFYDLVAKWRQEQLGDRQ